MNPRALLPLFAALAAAPDAFAQIPGREDELVVTADRPRGSVPGDFVPETTFTGNDIRSYGATSIFQILAAIAPQHGSASVRGGGFPIVLVNGRRITGFQEIRDLPPEVISRVEVFDEQLALQYGYSADQRVVNLILERRFDARSAEAGGGAAAGDARALGRGELRWTEIEEGDRIALGAGYDAASKVTELEREIAPPLVGPDARDQRTLAPDSENWRANASLSRALSERLTGNASVRYEEGAQTALLGLDSLAQRRTRETETETLRGALGLDGAVAGWQWTATATADASTQTRETTDAVSPAFSSADTTLYDLTANANGALMDVPAGRLRASFRAGVESRRIDSFSSDMFGDRSVELDRTTPSARVTLTAPLTSRRREVGDRFGDLSLNATASWSSPSDFDALSSFGWGASWSPTQTLRFSLQVENSDAAPTLQQLGDPITSTPDVAFYDPVLGEDVAVTYTTGGSPDLLAEEREDVIVNASWSPTQVRGLTLSLSWAQNNSTDAVVPFPTALPEAVLSFPSRFVRDLGGSLVAVDARPINIASRDIESVRWGVSYSRSIGSPPRTDRQAGPDDGEQRPNFAPGGANTGRWNLSVYHRMRLLDDLVLSPGDAPIDLIDRGGLSIGETASSLEFEGGLFHRGIGLRFNGGWTESYDVPVASGGALSFSDRWTVNARMFISLDARPGLIEAAPYLRGTRLSLSIDNLTDSFVEVRDETGATPVSYQEGYQNPLGRVVQISLQKQF